MKKFVIAIIAVALVSLGGLFVIAQSTGGSGKEHKGMGKGGHHRDGKMHRGGGMMMLKGLDLTDEQKATVKAFHEASKPTVQPLMEAMKANRQKMREAKNSGADQAQLEAIKAEAEPIRQQVKAFREASEAQIVSILTEEQRTKFAEMKADRENRMKDGKGKRRGHGRERGTEQ